jgi:hypothetical protein
MVLVIQTFPKKSINPKKKRKRNHITSTNKEKLQDIHLENDCGKFLEDLKKI